MRQLDVAIVATALILMALLGLAIARNGALIVRDILEIVFP